MLGKALGEGTFGKVKLGTHILTGEKVSSSFQRLQLNNAALTLHLIFKCDLRLFES